MTYYAYAYAYQVLGLWHTVHGGGEAHAEERINHRRDYDMHNMHNCSVRVLATFLRGINTDILHERVAFALLLCHSSSSSMIANPNLLLSSNQTALTSMINIAKQ